MSSFFSAPRPGVPEGIDGLVHALKMLHSTYGFRSDAASIAMLRRAASLGMDIALIVDLRTVGDGKIHRLRYNAQGGESGSYVDADGVSVHVDSEAYDFEFAIGLGVPESVRVYVTSRSGSKSLGDKGLPSFVFEGSEIVGKGRVYRVFLSEDDVDESWIDAVSSRRLDFFLSLPKKRSSGSLSKLPSLRDSERTRLEKAGWDDSKIEKLLVKAAESDNPLKYINQSVRFAEIDAHRRSLYLARMEEAKRELAARKSVERELFHRMLDEANGIIKKMDIFDATNAEMAVNRKFFGYSDEDLVALGYPGRAKNSREQRISRGSKALIAFGASALLSSMLRRRSTVIPGKNGIAAGAWDGFYRDYVAQNGHSSSGGLHTSSAAAFGLSAVVGAAVVRLLSKRA